MYEDVERAFAAPTLTAYFDKSWLSHTQLKASVYDVEALAQVRDVVASHLQRTSMLPGLGMHLIL
jgi:hypothetical protein